jgi:CDP-paratose 2-epimerase
VLITGGAGFVGANLATSLAVRHPDWSIVALDNLHRRGAELTLGRLRDAGVQFVHGDVREPADVAEPGDIDALVECSAEPSVLAGLESGMDFVVKTNLVGAYNCLELARRHGAALIFLSTSRVYPIEPLNALRVEERDTRFELAESQPLDGVSVSGVSEDFPLAGTRTFYGATKLAAELLLAEYVASFGLRGVVNRCGVVAGPWQMGKVDQGVFAYWLLAHYFGRSLRYLGFGGSGKQVRDLLHVDDLVDLIDLQLADPETWAGQTLNVGGGRDCSLSLVELTDLCRSITGRRVDVERAADDQRPGDVPLYLSDCGRLFALTEWRPARGPRDILEDVFDWARSHEAAVKGALGFG